MRHEATSTYGGRIDQTAVIGHAPESRDWRPGDPWYAPELGDGVRIEAYVTIDAGASAPTQIGDRTWLLKHSHIGHDATVGADCEIAPGAVIGGYCVIGDGVKVGINACVKPRVTIGDGARIGMGAVVVKDVPAGVTVVGNPAGPLHPPDTPDEGMETEIDDPLLRWLADLWRRWRAAHP